MVYINLLIIILIILLAVMGRKNKSKYKAVKGGNAVGFWLSLGKTLCDMSDIRITALEKLFQRTRVITEEKARAAAKEFMIRSAAVCLCVLFHVNLISVFYGVCAKKSETENLIIRQEYEGEEEEYELIMTDSENKEVYSLKVAPVEYTEEEFYERSEAIYSELSQSILGENVDLQHIEKDMCLSEYDSSGLIHLTWVSRQPEILSSNGQVDNLSISEGLQISLEVTMEYGKYEKKYSYDVCVVPVVEEESDSGIDAAKKTLSELEQEKRQDREFLIPSEVSGVNITLAEDKDYTQVKLIILGVCVCFMCVCMKYFSLKEEGDKVDAGLEDSYVGFVESLNLLIESGMTVKKAVEYLSSHSGFKGKLSDELKYAINMMETGYDEVYTYEQLGARLALPGYTRLFNYISQNIRKGNSNLKAVLNNCAYEASQIGREQIRKRGEKTSTKLLFPMIMLLAAVMLIIIVPALISF
jgi:predicted transcriptional regulator with HTH domain